MTARWRRAVCLVCAAAGVLWLARGGAARAELSARREFPRRAPSALAHLLADFSTLPHLAPCEPDPGSWRVEEERGNYSSWRYEVRWRCGAGGAGRARVAAHESAAGAHRVHLLLRLCADAAAPCDEMEIRADVETDGAGGAVLRERASASCARGGGEECAARLRTHRALHHRTLARGA